MGNIKVGAYQGADDENPGTIEDRHFQFGSDVGHYPYIYHDFYNQYANPVDGPKNYNGENLFTLFKTLRAREHGPKRLMLTFNIKPSGTKPTGYVNGTSMWNVWFDGGTLTNGFTGDEHMLMFAYHLHNFVQEDTSGEARNFVRLRIMHEMTGSAHWWSAHAKDGQIQANWNYKVYRKAWRRFVAILEGGSLATINGKITDNSSTGFNNGDGAQQPLNFDSTRMSGFPDLNNGASWPVNRVGNGEDVGLVFCTNANPQPTDNDFTSYIPTPHARFVQFMASDIYPGDDQAGTQNKIDYVQSVYQHANNNMGGKKFIIAETSRKDSVSDTDFWKERMKQIFVWLESKANMDAVVHFNCSLTGSVNGGNFHIRRPGHNIHANMVQARYDNTGATGPYQQSE